MVLRRLVGQVRAGNTAAAYALFRQFHPDTIEEAVRIVYPDGDIPPATFDVVADALRALNADLRG